MAVALRTIEGSISSKLLLSETYHYENPWKLTRVEMSSHVVFPTVGAFRGHSDGWNHHESGQWYHQLFPLWLGLRKGKNYL